MDEMIKPSNTTKKKRNPVEDFMALFFPKNNSVVPNELNQNNHINTMHETFSLKNLKESVKDDDDNQKNHINTTHNNITKDNDNYIYETESRELSKY